MPDPVAQTTDDASSRRHFASRESARTATNVADDHRAGCSARSADADDICLFFSWKTHFIQIYIFSFVFNIFQIKFISQMFRWCQKKKTSVLSHYCERHLSTFKFLFCSYRLREKQFFLYLLGLSFVVPSTVSITSESFSHTNNKNVKIVFKKITILRGTSPFFFLLSAWEIIKI